MESNLVFSGQQHTLEINRDHYIRRLGMPKDHDIPEHIEAAILETADWYHSNGNPWLHIYELDVVISSENLYLNNTLIRSPKIFKRYKKYEVSKAMLIACTAGDNVDHQTSKLWSSDLPDMSFFLDIYAASVTESIVSFAVDQIKEWTLQKGINSLSRYSPGYPGWDLEEQIILMNIIGEITKEKMPITISDTALLSPLKSQLSLVGLYHGDKKEKSFDSECLRCTFVNCSCKRL